MDGTKRRFDHIVWKRTELCFQDIPASMLAEMIERHKKDSCLVVTKGDTVHYIHYRMPRPEDFIPYEK